MLTQSARPWRGCDILNPSDKGAVLAWVAEMTRRPIQGRDPLEAVVLRFAGYELDLGGHRLSDENRSEIALTRGEFALLREFAERPAHVLSRDYLLSSLAGRQTEAFDRSIDCWSRGCAKIELNPKQPNLIVTVPGTGYKFAVDVERREPARQPLLAQPVEGTAWESRGANSASGEKQSAEAEPLPRS